MRRISSDGPDAAATGSSAPSPTAGDGDGGTARPAAARPADSADPSVPGGLPNEGLKAQQEPNDTANDKKTEAGKG